MGKKHGSTFSFIYLDPKSSRTNHCIKNLMFSRHTVKYFKQQILVDEETWDVAGGFRSTSSWCSNPEQILRMSP